MLTDHEPHRLKAAISGEVLRKAIAELERRRKPAVRMSESRHWKKTAGCGVSVQAGLSRPRIKRAQTEALTAGWESTGTRQETLDPRIDRVTCVA